MGFFFFSFLHFTICGIESSDWHTCLILLLHFSWDVLIMCRILSSCYILSSRRSDIKSRFEPVPVSFPPFSLPSLAPSALTSLFSPRQQFGRREAQSNT